MKKALFVMLLCVLNSAFNDASARGRRSGGFSFGGNLNYNMYSEEAMPKMGLSAFGDYSWDGEKSIRVSFNYMFPKTSSYDQSAYAYSSATTPYYITVPTDIKFSMWSIYVDGKYFFGDADNEDGGFYGMAGAGFSMATASSTPNAKSGDELLYEIDEATSESTSQLYIRLALGYDIAVSDGFFVYGEPFLNLAANSVNETEVEVTLPGCLGINAGVRILIQ